MFPTLIIADDPGVFQVTELKVFGTMMRSPVTVGVTFDEESIKYPREVLVSKINANGSMVRVLPAFFKPMTEKENPVPAVHPDPHLFEIENVFTLPSV